MKRSDEARYGIGFATGRRGFQKVLGSYVYGWYEGPRGSNVKLELFVAYDLKFSNTRPTDFIKINSDVRSLIDETEFIGSTAINREIDALKKEGVLNEKEARLFFESGYAGRRNAILFFALKNRVDYLLFLDDDEYPIAVTKSRAVAVWGGQHVMRTHLDYIDGADLTNGFHCGYISPVPYISFDGTLTERDFRCFIEAISNDIINWDTISSVMRNGGVTYADTDILVNPAVSEVKEVRGAKFITGGNLCINLTRPERLFAFYNPPGARGEDTFLSTCLCGRTVLRVPCYTFHDGFSTYSHLMDGVLPTRLKYIEADTEDVALRFYRACIGWVRYKPLFLYITRRDDYDELLRETRSRLSFTVPKLAAYFRRRSFHNILRELDFYDKHVREHYEEFLEAQRIMKRLASYLAGSGGQRDNALQSASRL